MCIMEMARPNEQMSVWWKEKYARNKQIFSRVPAKLDMIIFTIC